MSFENYGESASTWLTLPVNPKKMASNYAWVDDGLAKLGFTLDAKASELPTVVRPEKGRPLSVASTMDSMAALFASKLSVTNENSNPDANWSVNVGFYDGGAVATERTIISSIRDVSTEDYMKLFIDESMLEIAKLWDATYVEGGFQFIITKDGRAFKVDEDSFAGLPVQDVAKIMRWVFAAPGVAKREIVSVYVTSLTKDEMCVAYFPVRGVNIPIASGLTRGRLLVPCLDRVLFKFDGTSTFEHYATATLSGWMPNFILNSFIGRKKYVEAATEEAEHFTQLLSKQGELGSRFAAVTRRDGTSVL